jgi:penicillin-binding protein 1A
MTWGRFLLMTAATLFVLALLVGTIGATWLALYLREFEKKAGEFDLAEVREMEAASVLFDRQGREIGKLFIQNRNPVALSEMSPYLIQAVIAAEDTRFYEHKGIDWMGVARAAVENWRQGRIAQGASTVTQQLARNSFEMRERTYERKLVEMFLARRIETEFTKDEIMELYLNRVYFGSGFYGAEAAARGYFGKPASELGIGESAMLAGLLRSPQALSPWNNLRAATNIRNVVLRQMRDQGFISRQELREESDAALDIQPRRNLHRVSYSNDLIRQQAIAALGFERAMNGGYRIFTTLDMDLQQAAERALLAQLEKIEARPEYHHETYAEYRQRYSQLENRIDRGDPSLRLPAPRYLQGALLALDNSTGGILAMVGGRDFRHSEYNRAMQARRPAGTVFTPIVYASAFDHGISPATVVDDACIDNRFVMVGGATGILGEWGVERPHNEYEGMMTARRALVSGKNAATVRLGFQLGLARLRETAAAMGIRSPLRDYSNAYLGSSEMTLEELTLAYTVFPNQGRRPERTFIIQRIEDGNGREIYSAAPELIRAISGVAAFQTHLALEEVAGEGVENLLRTRDGLGDFPVAGKNGTAYGFTDTYFIGYTNEVTAGVWVGFDRPTRIYRGAFGRDLAMPVWANFMNQVALKIPPNPFRRSLEVEPVEICMVSGLKGTPKCQHDHGDGHGPRSTTYIEFLTPDQKPQSICDVHAGGVRSFVKEYREEEWPRAAPAIDLTRIRPIAVTDLTLIGFNDIYRAVQPGVARMSPGEVPVAKALPVEFADGSQAAASAIGETDEGVPVAAAIPIQGPGEQEIRRAEVRAGFTPLERPAIQMAAPPPTQF